MKQKCPFAVRAAGRRRWNERSSCHGEGFPSNAFIQQTLDCEGQFDGPELLIALGLAADDTVEIPCENADPALEEALREYLLGVAADEFLLAVGIDPAERAAFQAGMAPEAGRDEEIPEPAFGHRSGS